MEYMPKCVFITYVTYHQKSPCLKLPVSRAAAEGGGQQPSPAQLPGASRVKNPGPCSSLASASPSGGGRAVLNDPQDPLPPHDDVTARTSCPLLQYVPVTGWTSCCNRRRQNYIGGETGLKIN